MKTPTSESSAKEVLAYFTYLAGKRNGIKSFLEPLCHGDNQETEDGDIEFVCADSQYDGHCSQVVIKFLGRYFQFHYAYSSWDCSEVDTDDFAEVFPKEKTTIVYETSK